MIKSLEDLDNEDFKTLKVIKRQDNMGAGIKINYNYVLSL